MGAGHRALLALLLASTLVFTVSAARALKADQGAERPAVTNTRSPCLQCRRTSVAHGNLVVLRLQLQVPEGVENRPHIVEVAVQTATVTGFGSRPWL